MPPMTPRPLLDILAERVTALEAALAEQIRINHDVQAQVAALMVALGLPRLPPPPDVP